MRCIELNHYRLVDSLSHISGSLADLTSRLKKTPSFPWTILRQASFLQTDDHQVDEHAFSLLQRKGAFPFSRATSLKALAECRDFPPRSEFRYSLNGNDYLLDEETYNDSKEVYSYYEMESLLAYMDLYLRLDCFCLCEILYSYNDYFRSLFNNLSPLSFLTFSSYSWNSFLYLSKCRIQYLDCKILYNLFEVEGSLYSSHFPLLQLPHFLK